MKTLQQRIMQVPRDARPLADALFQAYVEPVRQLTHSELIKRPEQHHKSRRAAQAEPDRLVVRRRDGKIQKRARLVPHTAVIARRHAKRVLARPEVRILHLRWFTTSRQYRSCPSSLKRKCTFSGTTRLSAV